MHCILRCQNIDIYPCQNPVEKISKNPIHGEALDDEAVRELVGHYVAYRKLVSRSPSELLPESRFRQYAVAARFPYNLASQVPWQEVHVGVYGCQWGLDMVRVVVAGQLPREPHNAPLHLFSASPELVGFGRGAYQQRSARTSRLLGQLFETFQGEGLVMPYTMQDFERDYVKEHFPKLTPEEQAEVLQSLPPEKLLAALSPEQIKHVTSRRSTTPRKPRWKR